MKTIHINPDFEVRSVIHYLSDRGDGVEYSSLYNHHAITQYVLEEGFEVFK